MPTSQRVSLSNLVMISENRLSHCASGNISDPRSETYPRRANAARLSGYRVHKQVPVASDHVRHAGAMRLPAPTQAVMAPRAGRFKIGYGDAVDLVIT
jgi:hypothetical protein